jgi:predicted metal-dependent HD superfamily phosphohydrolase
VKAIGQEFVDFFDLQAAEEEQRERARAELARALIEAVGDVPGVDALGGELWHLMSAPGRHYHTAVHVLAILGAAQRHGVEPERADLYAVLFHDAVYDPRAEPGRNEEASAELLLERLPALEVPREVCERAAESIRWTAHHADPLAPAEHALMLDLDLIGLASPPPAFRRQSTALELEMRHMAPEDYFRGTIELFTKLVERPAIYHTAQLAPLEQAARANVEAELLRMKALL